MEEIEKPKVKLNDAILSTLAPAKIFKDCAMDINSLDFSDDGKYLVTGSDDNVVNLYDVQEGRSIETFYNKRYGVNCVTFTHTSKNILCASHSENEGRIMYWSLYDNTIIMSFLGHTDEITSLQMNPSNDTFISTSKDNTTRVWDLYNKKLLVVFDKSKAATFDNSGAVLVIVQSKEVGSKVFNYLNLFGTKEYNEKAFSVFTLEDSEIRLIRVSPNGTYILCSTDNSIILLDAYTGEQKKRFDVFENGSGCNIETSFSWDSKYIVSGSDTGTVNIWNIESAHLVAKLNKHIKSVNSVKFSNKYLLLASACQNLIFWLPTTGH